MQLNELTQGQRGRLPPTDSRLRPDIRALEEGRFAQVTLLGADGTWPAQTVPAAGAQSTAGACIVIMTSTTDDDHI